MDGKHLSGIRTYDEAKLMANYEKDPMFCVIDSAMRFLFYALSRESRPKKASSRRGLLNGSEILVVMDAQHHGTQFAQKRAMRS